MRYIGVAERRERLGVRHRLAEGARAGRPEEVAEALVALHGSDPATVYLAVGARLADAGKTVEETGRALYEDRTLVRMHGMRHTVFVFPAELTAVVHASTGLVVAGRERASLVKDMAKAGAPDAPGWRTSRRPRWPRWSGADRRPRPNSPRTSRGCGSSSCTPPGRATRVSTPSRPGC